MMVFTPIGMNLSVLNTLSNISLNISTTPTGILNDIPAQANLITNNYLGFGIMLGLFAILIFVLSDKTPLADFGYSDSRAFTLSSGISASLGLIMIDLGFITDFKAIVVMLLLFMIGYIIVLQEENKE